MSSPVCGDNIVMSHPCMHGFSAQFIIAENRPSISCACTNKEVLRSGMVLSANLSSPLMHLLKEVVK